MVSISSLLMNLYISNQKIDNRYDIKKTFSPVGIEVVDCEAVLYLFIVIAWSKTLTVFTDMRQKEECTSQEYIQPHDPFLPGNESIVQCVEDLENPVH